jgi:hypothetical protein
MVQFNFKNYTCQNFHQYLLKSENHDILKQIGASEKYEYHRRDEDNQVDEDESSDNSD